jgi:hypothetical protein
VVNPEAYAYDGEILVKAKEFGKADAITIKPKPVGAGGGGGAWGRGDWGEETRGVGRGAEGAGS